jgi:hypothetical protein
LCFQFNLVDKFFKIRVDIETKKVIHAQKAISIVKFNIMYVLNIIQSYLLL